MTAGAAPPVAGRRPGRPFWVFWRAPTFVFDETFSGLSLVRTFGWALLLVAGSVVLAVQRHGRQSLGPHPLPWHPGLDHGIDRRAWRGARRRLGSAVPRADGLDRAVGWTERPLSVWQAPPMNSQMTSESAGEDVQSGLGLSW